MQLWRTVGTSKGHGKVFKGNMIASNERELLRIQTVIFMPFIKAQQII